MAWGLFHADCIQQAVINAVHIVIKHQKRPSATNVSMLYLRGILVLTSTRLSGPPAWPNEQLKGTDDTAVNIDPGNTSARSASGFGRVKKARCKGAAERRLERK